MVIVSGTVTYILKKAVIVLQLELLFYFCSIDRMCYILTYMFLDHEIILFSSKRRKKCSV